MVYVVSPFVLCMHNVLSWALYYSILQDIGVQSKDFEGSLAGLSQHFKCSNHSHGKIVMPESMVISGKLYAIQHGKQKEKYSAQGTSIEEAHAQEHEHMHVQYRDVKQAVQPPHQQPSPRPSGSPNEQLYIQPPTGTSSARGRVHVYESPKRTQRDLLKMRDDRLLDHHSEGEGGSNVSLRHQRSLPAPNGVADHQDPLFEHMHCQLPHSTLPEATQGIQIQPQVHV